MEYPGVNFEVSDTQRETIEQSTMNMFDSLRDAIIMSTIVVFLFLASFRQILVVLVTIPLVYASTIALMWLVGIDFNVVTLTAIKIRTRPVLMTAFAVSAGMLPVAGLERLAPLGAVAIGGLIIGTFMTLVFIPVVFIWTVKEKNIIEEAAV